MSNIYVEREGTRKYIAIQNKRVIATGETQAKAAATAHRMRREDPVLGERVRDTKAGSRDKWRRMIRRAQRCAHPCQTYTRCYHELHVWEKAALC